MTTRDVTWTSMKDLRENLFLARAMHRFMIQHNGIGLAANQLGIRKSMFVMDVEGSSYYVFNPLIIERSKEETIREEGCLSFPGKILPIKRPESIIAVYTTVDKKAIDYPENATDQNVYSTRKEFSGLTARCFQHEFDHLNGISFQDQVYYENT